jgi:hypothetical protein
MFVNRQEYLQLFQSMLLPTSEEWLLVLHGLSGTGKSTLLQELACSHVPASTYSQINFDETIFCSQPFEVIHSLEEGLMNCGLPSQEWEKYRTRSRKINRWIHNQQIRLTYQVHQKVEASGGSQISDISQQSTLNLDRQAWERQVEVSAARDQVQALIELCQKLNMPFVIFLDHWDSLVKIATNDYIDWIIQGLLLKLHKALGSLRIVIAGDKPLDETTLAKGVVQIELAPFTAPDAASFMQILSLQDQNIQSAIYEWTGGNPLLIQLAVELWKLEPHITLEDLAEGWNVKAASQWLLQRILTRLPDDRSRKVLERGVILRKWTLNDLANVFSQENLDLQWYNDFIKYPFVEHLSRPPGYKSFIRSVREIQISQLWQNKMKDYLGTHSNAYHWYTGGST